MTPLLDEFAKDRSRWCENQIRWVDCGFGCVTTIDMSEAQTTTAAAAVTAKVYIDKPNATLYKHDVEVPPVPEDKASKGEPFSLQCAIELEPTDEMKEWAEEAGIEEYAFGFEDDTNVIQLELPDEQTAVLYRLRWG